MQTNLAVKTLVDLGQETENTFKVGKDDGDKAGPTGGRQELLGKWNAIFYSLGIKLGTERQGILLSKAQLIALSNLCMQGRE
jgi:hypothetical protein